MMALVESEAPDWMYAIVLIIRAAVAIFRAQNAKVRDAAPCVAYIATISSNAFPLMVAC